MYKAEILVWSLYFLFYELAQIKEQRLLYFFSFYNFADMISAFTNIVLVIYYWDDEHLKDPGEVRIMRFLCATAIGLMWFRLIKWMRLFDATAFYTRLLTETLSDIVTFLLLFIFVMGLFSNVLYIFNV